jgi:predicted protein tyrosine phosphatase
MVVPERHHVEAILDFGTVLARATPKDHLLIHCHAGVSRSTAAMAMLFAQAAPQESEDRIMRRLERVRPQAWPNSRMIAFADDLLGRKGRLREAVRRLHGRQLVARPHLANGMRNCGRGREVDAALV